MDALIQADINKLILIMLITSLPGLIALFREIARTVRERRENKDTGRLQTLQTRAAEAQRQDALLHETIMQFGSAIQQNVTLSNKLDKLADALSANNDVGIQAQQMRERIAMASNDALVSNTQAVGEVSINVNTIRKEVKDTRTAVDHQTILMGDGFGQTASQIKGKIDSAVNEAGKMLTKELDPVQISLTELRKTLDDVQEKVSHIPELERCMEETNRAMHDLTHRTEQALTERDAALNTAAELQQTLSAGRSPTALTKSDGPSEALPLSERPSS